MNILSVIMAGVLWGTMSIFIRTLNGFGFNPNQIMMMRAGLSALILGIVILIKDKSLFKIKIKDIWMFLCTGIVSLAFFSVCYFSSILENGAGVSVVLLYTSPVFVVILAAIFFKEKITGYKVAALVLTVAGCVLVAGIAGNPQHSITVKGLLLGLGSGLGYGLYSIFGTVALKKYKGLTVTFYSFLISSIFMIPLSNVGTMGGKISVETMLWFTGVAVCCTLLPFQLYTYGLSKLDAGKASIFVTVEPLVGTLIGLFLWKENPEAGKLIGIVLIFAAIIICQKSIVPSFLKKHHFKSDFIVNDIIYDMALPQPKEAGQDMFKTWMMPPAEKPVNEKVIVIDAGGTNFRSCLVTFDDNGNPSISDFNKSSMPGIEKEYSKKEFFEAIADKIDYLKGKADKIGFCFSYAMNITKDHDGIPNAFSKEVKAREVLGQPVGKCLVEELEKRGWNKIQKITLLNDTVSALLAGVAQSGKNSQYDSYIGFILGTGMNGAFITGPGTFAEDEQIIVCESGKCNTFELSDFDIEVDKKTDIPGQYPLEKCCSGAYLGKTCYEILLQAARDRLFTKETCNSILNMKELTTIEMDNYLYGKENPLSSCIKADCDNGVVRELLIAAVDRCAKYAASILSACLIAGEKGRNPEKPVCIVCNGTTLYKTYSLKEKMEKYLKQYTKKRGIYYKTVEIENDITIGTAVAGVI